MNEQILREKIHRAIDLRLAGMQPMHDIVKETKCRQTKKRINKRMNFRFVLVPLLIFVLSASAIAAVFLWKDYVGRMIEMEKENGLYWQWDCASKIALVETLHEMGYVNQEDSFSKLFDQTTEEQEKEKLADEIVLAFLENNPYIKEYETTFNHDIHTVTAGLLNFAIYGPSEKWTAEKRVWWQSITNPDGSSANDMRLVNPEDNEISEKEAILIATKALISTMNVSEAELENAQIVADMYITDERPQYKRWLVTFNILQEGSNQYIEHSYEVFIDGHGHQIADIDYGSKLLEEKAAYLDAVELDQRYTDILEVYQNFSDYEDSYLIRAWSLEAKAEYSKALRKRVQKLLEKDYPNTFSHGEIIASTRLVYGLPKVEDIQRNEAYELAYSYVCQEYDLELQQEFYFDSYEYYDITDADSPVWKFVFFPESFEGIVNVPVYKVTLDARTGDRKTVMRYWWKEIFDKKPYHEVWY
ncbi:MAG: hypothetical protein IJ354_07285 [Clostridia bacterium]|nr:hypothetical protein [Clostridia bacterium]